MANLGQCWRAVRDRFAATGIETAALDARLLVRYLLELDDTGLIARENEVFPSDRTASLEALVARRLAGEPVARIVGYQEFYGLRFSLNRATLIPRPETELLVDFGLERFKGRPQASILDLGTGTGCIALALLAHLPGARAVGIDLAENAVAQARANAAALGLEGRFDCRLGRWFDPLDPAERFEFIVSNPPYIAPHVIDTLESGVRSFDPRLALDGGADGLDAYRDILARAPDFLTEGGMLAVEIGFDQGDMVKRLFADHGFARVAIGRDLAGHERIVSGAIGLR